MEKKANQFRIDGLGHRSTGIFDQQKQSYRPLLHFHYISIVLDPENFWPSEPPNIVRSIFRSITFVCIYSQYHSRSQAVPFCLCSSDRNADIFGFYQQRKPYARFLSIRFASSLAPVRFFFSIFRKNEFLYNSRMVNINQYYSTFI